MKYNVTSNTVEKFPPVEITFRLESQQELDAFGSLFNTSCIITALDSIMGENIRWHEVYEALKAAGANIHLTTQFPHR